MIRKAHMPLGKASVEVEYEVTGGEATVLFASVNGIWIDAGEFLAEFVVEGWEDELSRQAAEDAKDARRKAARALGAVGAAAHQMARAA